MCARVCLCVCAKETWRREVLYIVIICRITAAAYVVFNHLDTNTRFARIMRRTSHNGQPFAFSSYFSCFARRRWKFFFVLRNFLRLRYESNGNNSYHRWPVIFDFRYWAPIRIPFISFVRRTIRFVFASDILCRLSE